MKYNFKESFDTIKAEDSLKDNTYKYLQEEIIKRRQKKRRTLSNFKYIYVSVFIAIICLGTFKGYSFYFEEVSFVSVDLNPSIELSLNRLDRVIGWKAYNKESEEILNSIKIKNKKYDEALETLITNEMFDRYIKDNSYISFTVYSNNSDKESLILDNVKSCADNFIYSHHQTAHIEYDAVNLNLKDEAEKYDISPGKYKVIKELQSVNPDIKIEDYRYSSVAQIKDEINIYISSQNNQNNINPNIQNYNHCGHNRHR